MEEEITYDILDDDSVHFYIIVEGRKVSDFIVPQEIMVNISRDIRKNRKRTLDDWCEIVKAMGKEFDWSLKDSLNVYKQDRNKWVDWFNNKMIKKFNEHGNK